MNDNHNKCTLCPPFHFSTDGLKCLPCVDLPDGCDECSAVTGLCSSCSAGYQHTENDCVPCPAGNYSTDGVRCLPCKDLPAGCDQCSAVTGECSGCSAGYELVPDEMACRPCSDGNFSADGSACVPCTDLPPGCAACNAATGLCAACVAGYGYDGAGGCTPCSEGTYSAGTTPCTDKCPAFSGSQDVCLNSGFCQWNSKYRVCYREEASSFVRVEVKTEDEIGRVVEILRDQFAGSVVVVVTDESGRQVIVVQGEDDVLEAIRRIPRQCEDGEEEESGESGLCEISGVVDVDVEIEEGGMSKGGFIAGTTVGGVAIVGLVGGIVAQVIQMRKPI